MYLPLATSAAFGVAFGILYKAASTLGRKRKKRGLNILGEGEEEEVEDASSLSFKFQDFLWHGKADGQGFRLIRQIKKKFVAKKQIRSREA